MDPVPDQPAGLGSDDSRGYDRLAQTGAASGLAGLLGAGLLLLLAGLGLTRRGRRS